MKKNLLFLALSFLLSCGNERELQLPKIDNAEITEIQDVSAAYLFYDETQPDSVLLNRKNLISTTNWLINVDKRLTLNQAIPHIKFLQDKKKNSSHKNEKAKNYFTCHDLSGNDLGFVEFTIVNFEENDIPETLFLKKNKGTINIHVLFNDKIQLTCYSDIIKNKSTSISQLKNDIKSLVTNEENPFTIVLSFNANVSFQDYISIKSELIELDTENFDISKDEFIY